MTDAELKTLSRILQRASGWSRKRLWWYLSSFGVTFLLLSVLGGFSNLLGDPGIVIKFFFAAAAALGPSSAFSWRFHKKSTVKLAGLDDMRALAPLADALSFPDPDVLYAVRPGLLRLLKRLTPEDAALLTERQRENLRHLLKRADVPLILTLLAAYQRIGDARELEAVQSLLRGKGEMAHEPQVRNAALECLPFLQAAVERSRLDETLLRASDQPSALPSELLRPARTTETADPQQLLRSTTDQAS